MYPLRFTAFMRLDKALAGLRNIEASSIRDSIGASLSVSMSE